MQENRDEPLPRWVRTNLPGRYYRAANGIVYHLTPGCPGCTYGEPRLAPPNCLKCAFKRARARATRKEDK